jgi:antitoxin ParD1/3/4
MAKPKPISVKLSGQQANLRPHLEPGHCDDASKVMCDALRALDERDAIYDEWLRAKVKASTANKKPNIPAEAVFKRLEARHARRVKATKRGA